MAWGLVSQVVPHDELMSRAQALAARVVVNPPDVLRMTKRLLQEGQHTRQDTLLELSASMQALAHHTQDHMEAVNALLEKRQGAFVGR